MIPNYQLTTKALWFIVKKGRNEFDRLTQELINIGSDLVALGWKIDRQPDNIRDIIEKE